MSRPAGNRTLVQRDPFESVVDPHRRFSAPKNRYPSRLRILFTFAKVAFFVSALKYISTLRIKILSIFVVAFPLDGFKDFNLLGPDALYLAQRFSAKLRSFQYRFGVRDGHVLRKHPAFLEISCSNL